ncbi:MAG: hypothetical protein GY804_14055 [Alphaproteobacteria bacterium]|nr:hypothetical protein [Alphaproteobacteria bacterium]
MFRWLNIRPRPSLEGERGRSMMEMLGVLAIIGMLSVGALAGYSIAMTKHTANQAINEIKDIVINTQDLYANENSYGSLTTGILRKAGILGASNTNVLKSSIYIMPWTVDSKSVFRLDYRLRAEVEDSTEYDEKICSKILLHGWLNELGSGLISIYIYYGPNSTDAIGVENPAYHPAATYVLPVTVDTANTVCKGAKVFILVMK